MPPTNEQLIADAQKALRLGNPQLADDILASISVTAAAAPPVPAVPAAAAPQPATPPRNPQQIITDMMGHLVMRAGNPPALEALLRELDHAVTPPPTE